MVEILKDIKNESGYISAYNKNEIMFKRSDGAAERAVITCSGHRLELYPDPTGVFHFFAGEFVTSLLSEFKDDYSYSESLNPEEEGNKLVHVFDFDIKLYSGNAIVSSTVLSNYKFLKSVDQINLKLKDFIDKCLSPTQNLKCYEGYPFEYSKLENGEVKRYLACSDGSAQNEQNSGYADLVSTQDIGGIGAYKDKLMFFDWAGVDYGSTSPTHSASFSLEDIEFKAEISNIRKASKNCSANTIADCSPIKGEELKSYVSLSEYYNISGSCQAIGFDMAWHCLGPSRRCEQHTCEYDIEFMAIKGGEMLPIEIAVMDAYDPDPRGFETYSFTDCPTLPDIKNIIINTNGSPFRLMEFFRGDSAELAEQDGNSSIRFKYKCDNGEPVVASGMFTTKKIGKLKLHVHNKHLPKNYAEAFNLTLSFAVKLPETSEQEEKPYQIIDKCGIYVKWLNQQGAYSYHMFEHNSIKELSAKSAGAIYDNNSDYDELLEIGKKGRYIQRIHTKLPVSEQKVLHSLMLTPEAYIYRGARFSGENKWERVRIINPNLKYADKNNNFISFTAVCELIKPLTQHL